PGLSCVPTRRSSDLGVEPPGWLFAALSGIAVAAGLIAAIVARIMAIPGVNGVLQKIGLAPEPKAKLTYRPGGYTGPVDHDPREADRKSTRLNSSHVS